MSLGLSRSYKHKGEDKVTDSAPFVRDSPHLRVQPLQYPSFLGKQRQLVTQVPAVI